MDDGSGTAERRPTTVPVQGGEIDAGTEWLSDSKPATKELLLEKTIDVMPGPIVPTMFTHANVYQIAGSCSDFRNRASAAAACRRSR